MYSLSLLKRELGRCFQTNHDHLFPELLSLITFYSTPYRPDSAVENASLNNGNQPVRLKLGLYRLQPSFSGLQRLSRWSPVWQTSSQTDKPNEYHCRPPRATKGRRVCSTAITMWAVFTTLYSSSIFHFIFKIQRNKNTDLIYICIIIIWRGARGSVVGWGTML
jgi:hypothetical protein